MEQSAYSFQTGRYNAGGCTQIGACSTDAICGHYGKPGEVPSATDAHVFRIILVHARTMDEAGAEEDNDTCPGKVNTTIHPFALGRGAIRSLFLEARSAPVTWREQGDAPTSDVRLHSR